MTDPLHFPPPSDDTIARLQVAHPKLLEYTLVGHTCLFRPLTQATWRRIQRIQGDSDSEESITDVAVTDTLAYPSPQEMSKLLADFPACTDAVVADLVEFAKKGAAKLGKRVPPRLGARPRPTAWAMQPSPFMRSFAAKIRKRPPWAPCSWRSSSR